MRKLRSITIPPLIYYTNNNKKLCTDRKDVTFWSRMVKCVLSCHRIHTHIWSGDIRITSHFLLIFICRMNGRVKVPETIRFCRNAYLYPVDIIFDRFARPVEDPGARCQINNDQTGRGRWKKCHTNRHFCDNWWFHSNRENWFVLS